MSKIQPVVIGKLDAEQLARYNRAAEVKAIAQEAAQMLVNSAMKAMTESLSHHRALVHELWTDVLNAHGLSQDRNGRYGLDPQPDGSVNIIDLETTHKLNCPVHGPQAEGKSN